MDRYLDDLPVDPSIPCPFRSYYPGDQPGKPRPPSILCVYTVEVEHEQWSGLTKVAPGLNYSISPTLAPCVYTTHNLTDDDDVGVRDRGRSVFMCSKIRAPCPRNNESIRNMLTRSDRVNHLIGTDR